MKRPRYSQPRSELRIADLKVRAPSGGKITNLKLPNRLAETAHKLTASTSRW